MGLADITYDVIIYGASVNGIIASQILGEKGKSVLLLNQFGFAGGSITESLNCVQNFEQDSLSPKLKSVIESLSDELDRREISGHSAYFLNPESVKYALQQNIARSGANVLFHVKAYRTEVLDDGLISLGLAAKEGRMTLRCRQLIDATEDGTLGIITGMLKPAQATGLYNIIVTGKGVEPAMEELKPAKSFKISNERYWASFNIPDADGLYADSAVQTVSDEISAVLIKHSSRIQLLPACFQRMYSFQSGYINSKAGNVILLNPQLLHDYRPENLIKTAAELEMQLMIS